MSQLKLAKFSIGQLVYHKLFDYRGVVIDVDPCFMHSEQWYQQMAKSRPPKDEPWYRILVHNANHETYVAEQNLRLDLVGDPVKNPSVDEFFSEFKNGRYLLAERTN